MSEHRTFGQWSFNAGEISPRMVGRVDQQIYASACDTMEGWLPLIQGPAVAAPGTLFVEEAAGPCILIDFEFNPTQGYTIEASAGKFRFYTNDARIETAPGVPYEVGHTYSLAELQQLTFWQSNDVLYMAGGGKRPTKLTRLTATTFQFDNVALTEGPIGTANADPSKTIHVSGTSGEITITADAPIFVPTDVLSFFEIVANDMGDVQSWEPGMVVSVGNLREWGGRVYEVTGVLGRTGGNPPEHDEGVAWDGSGSTDINGKGPYGVAWLYRFNAFGLVQLSEYISATQVKALVINPLATSVAAVGTWRWAFGAFSDTRGWPETVGGWNGCLTLTKGNRTYTSVIEDYENFGRRDNSGDFQRDLAGGFSLPKPATIRWQRADRLLLLGSDTDEYTVERVQVQTGTPGPPVFEIKLQSSNGSSAIAPIQADGRILFLQRAGRKLREFGYAIQSDRYLAPDMTRLADHIGAAGFVDLAWQAEPERFVWAVRGDGVLAAMTYDPEQQVMGWARRPLGGGMMARSICRITDPSGRHDQLWIAAETEAGKWLILRMAKLWEYGDEAATAVMADAALQYDGAADDSFGGLAHLEGQTVDVLADGAAHRQLTVSDGAVTLDYPASRVTIGLPIPNRLKLLPPEAGQDEGVARGKTKRVLDVTLHVIETGGIRVRVQGNEWVEIETREPGAPLDVAAPLLTGLMKVLTIGSFDDFGQVEIERFQPTPATIAAVVPTVEVGER